MNPVFVETILQSIGAKEIEKLETIQTLWSGYGELNRYKTTGSDWETVVVKHIQFPKRKKHPRGWNTDISHERKVRSYEVEVEWYKNFAAKTTDACKLPRCYAVDAVDDEVIIVMEDLDNAGFGLRKTSVNTNDIYACINWLAHFHAVYMNEAPAGLWETGTYWHLATRPDELAVLDDKELKKYASAIDERLNTAKYKTIVHGDAKLANFCFSRNGKVAAVDFQYTGGGCGMKDLAYFIGSCLYEDECEEFEQRLLQTYFDALKEALTSYSVAIDFDELEKEWRELYLYAWTDFHRFLKGWSPGHREINSYSEKLARNVIAQLKHR